LLPQLQTELLDALKETSPFYFLPNIAQWALLSGMDESGERKPPPISSLDQSHVELAQAAYLTIEPADLSVDPRWEPFGPIIEKLAKISDAFRDARFLQIETASTPEDRRLIALQERIRLHTQTVRNWGHYEQVKRILHTLYSPLDEQCEQTIGLRATELLFMFDKMLRLVEERGTDQRLKLSAAYSKTTKREILEEYGRQFGVGQAATEDVWNFARAQKMSRLALRHLLLAHSGLFAMEIYAFGASEIASWLGRSEADVKLGLDHLSYGLGALVGHPFEHLFLGNPVWLRPLLEVEQGKYLCVLPQAFFAFSFHIFDEIFTSSNDSGKAHGLVRAAFLESAIEKIFRTAFSEHTIDTNVKWSYEGVDYETDLLVQIDSCLFIIEAKSWPALRGAPGRMKKHIEEMFTEPALQSKRLEDAIWETKAGSTELKLNSRVDLSKIHEIIRISITLEDFATIQSNLKEIARTQKPEFPMAVTMSLADLESVFELLDSPIEKMHYLQRRSEIQQSVHYLADELDLLGLYLDTGFELGEFERGEKVLIATGMSKKVDDFFDAKAEGIEATKPKRHLTAWFAETRDRLAERAPPRWTEAASMLLDIGPTDQEKFEVHFEKLRGAMRQRRLPRGQQENIALAFPPVWRDFGIACVAVYEDEFNDRLALIDDAALQIFQRSAAKKCLVIARDVEGRRDPYVALAVCDRPHNLPLPSEQPTGADDEVS
jgi:hypothetical protein